MLEIICHEQENSPLISPLLAIVDSSMLDTAPPLHPYKSIESVTTREVHGMSSNDDIGQVLLLNEHFDVIRHMLV